YSYSGLWPSLQMGVGHSLTRRGGLVIDGNDIGYDEDAWTFGTSVTLPVVRHIIENSDLTFSYNLAYLRNVSKVPPPDPSALLPKFPETGRISGFAMSWSWYNIRRFQYSVSEESGRYISLSLALGAKFLGGTHDLWSASWQWHEWIPMPWKPKP